MRVYPLASQDRTFSLTHAAIDMSLGTSLPVCTENLNPDIVVMKPAEDRA